MARIAKSIPMLLLAGLVLAPGAASAQEAFEMSDLTEMPSFKSAQQAQRAIVRSYPRTLQDAGIGGTVQVRFIVSADGSVLSESIEIVASSSKALGDAARQAVGDIQFKPGKKDGSAVPAVVVMPIRYTVQ